MFGVMNGLVVSFLVAVLLSKVTPVITCTFYNYPDNTAMVKSSGGFYGHDLYGCMWLCYNSPNCVMISYQHDRNLCILMEESDTEWTFSERKTDPIIENYRIDYSAMEPGCPLHRLFPN